MGNLCSQFEVRISKKQSDILLAQKLRTEVFRNNSRVIDADTFDQKCSHLLVIDKSNDRVVCVCRILMLENGNEIESSYSAQFYNLSRLRKIDNPVLEMGRFCVDPDYQATDIIIIALGTLIKYVETNNICFLFGCSSFKGVEETDHQDAFIFLTENHLAPKQYKPFVKAPCTFRFAETFRNSKPGRQSFKDSLLPPLLRYYVSLGAWVSDHAVKDFDLKTLHVFTGLNIKSIPKHRKKFLTRIAGYL